MAGTNWVNLLWLGEKLLMNASVAKGHLLWASRDGLRTATVSPLQIEFPLALAADESGTVWMASLERDGVTLNRSQDGGTTFMSPGG